LTLISKISFYKSWNGRSLSDFHNKSKGHNDKDPTLQARASSASTNQFSYRRLKYCVVRLNIKCTNDRAR